MMFLQQGKSHNLVYLMFQLLLSGDVELNPGPLTRDPREILRKNFTNLTNAISINLLPVAGALFAKELIPGGANGRTLVVGISDYIKASELMIVLQSLLEASSDQRQYLINVCNVLKDLVGTKDLAITMLKQLGVNDSDSIQQGTSTEQPPATGNNGGTGGTEETDTGHDSSEGATAAQTIIVPEPPDVSEWCPPMWDIAIDEFDYTKELVADVNIILVTATETEYRAVMGTGTQIEGSQGYTQVEKDVTFNLVMYGSHKVAVIRTGQGPYNTSDMLHKIREVIDAQYVIAIGICYGMKEGKTKLGDVIVAESIMDTSNRRALGDKAPARPDGCRCGAELSNIFQQTQGYRFKSGESDGKDQYVAVRYGVLVSENTLVASQVYKDDILKQIPQALGGEMEGVGLIRTAIAGNYEGIVIKAVADWGNEDKEPYRKWQEFAAVAAAKYVLYRLKSRASEKFKKPNLN